MELNAKIYVAGHRGLVGSAILKHLQAAGYTRLITRTHAELDLTRQAEVQAFFDAERPDFVFMAAARVGGIVANNSYPADFIRDNLLIQTHVIDAAYRSGVQRLLFLGSSCIYPKFAPQPMTEPSLLTGPLEATNRPYALAKIAGVEMCWSYNRQYGTRFVAAMPTNLYGPGDNYHLENSHVIPALIRKFHEAKIRGDKQVTVWGTGTPRREFMYSEDMASACVFLMSLPEARYDELLGSDEAKTGVFTPPIVNIGVGDDISISDLALLVKEVTGFDGELNFDTSKPDGTPRKLMDTSLLNRMGWTAPTPLRQGLEAAYQDFLASH
ncbi:MAG: GDP-L-fucose synthase [Burkholderiaceae bacterium]|nr:GDP-L-fucose synthase [Burkholderiaceae bacterium]